MHNLKYLYYSSVMETVLKENMRVHTSGFIFFVAKIKETSH